MAEMRVNSLKTISMNELYDNVFQNHPPIIDDGCGDGGGEKKAGFDYMRWRRGLWEKRSKHLLEGYKLKSESPAIAGLFDFFSWVKWDLAWLLSGEWRLDEELHLYFLQNARKSCESSGSVIR